MLKRASQNELLDQYAESVVRSNRLQAEGSEWAYYSAKLECMGDQELREQERALRRAIAKQLDQMGHPVLSTKLSSWAPWAGGAILPPSNDRVTWSFEDGCIVALTSKRYANHIANKITEMTKTIVCREELPECSVRGVETTQRALKWLMQGSGEQARH